MSDICVVLSVDLIIFIDSKTCESLVEYSRFGLDYFSYWRQSYYKSDFINIVDYIICSEFYGSY